MRRIKLNNTIFSAVSDFYDNLFDNNQTFKQIDFDLDLLVKRFSKLPWTQSKKKYVELLKNNLKPITKATPREIEKWKIEFDQIIPHTSISKSFHETILKTLNYSYLRGQPILPLYQTLNVCACVYCNAQLNVVLDVEYYKRRPKKGQVKTRKATFELDHFWAKSKYPFLGISFFNLVPCCSSCNKSKLNSEAKFYLYAENDPLDVFEFQLENRSILKYWKTKNPNDLKLEFNSLLPDNNILDNHNELFKIKELYNTQIGIAEELIHKRFSYSKAYKLYLEKDYKSKLFSDQAIIKRLIIGNYDKPEDVHKRPMAKFTQDIAKQLGLI